MTTSPDAPRPPTRLPLTSIRRWPSCALAGALALAGCGETVDAPSGPDAGDDVEPVAPTLTVSPPDGARGVLVSEPIVLTFSQPMDAASVEAALSSASLPAADLALSWNDDQTVLSIDASAVLAYPVGGRDVAPFTYQLTIADSATDVDGEPLAAAVTTSFQTARDVTFGLGRLVAATGCFDGGATGVDLRVGDTASNGTWRGFVTLDLTGLPTVVELRSAILAVRQTSVVGAPYADLGALRLIHLAPITTIDLAAYQATPIATIGALSTTADVGSPGGDRSLDILDEVAADTGAGHAATTFRIEFDAAHDLGSDVDHVIFDPTSVDAQLRALAE